MPTFAPLPPGSTLSDSTLTVPDLAPGRAGILMYTRADGRKVPLCRLEWPEEDTPYPSLVDASRPIAYAGFADRIVRLDYSVFPPAKTTAPISNLSTSWPNRATLTYA